MAGGIGCGPAGGSRGRDAGAARSGGTSTDRTGPRHGTPVAAGPGRLLRVAREGHRRNGETAPSPCRRTRWSRRRRAPLAPAAASGPIVRSSPGSTWRTCSPPGTSRWGARAAGVTRLRIRAVHAVTTTSRHRGPPPRPQRRGDHRRGRVRGPGPRREPASSHDDDHDACGHHHECAARSDDQPARRRDPRTGPPPSLAPVAAVGLGMVAGDLALLVASGHPRRRQVTPGGEPRP